MSPQFRLAARYLLEHPQDIAVESMRSIAGRIGVQPPTMVRLAQSLGFDGWPQLRALYVERVRSRPEPYALRARDLVRRGDPKALIAESLRAQQANLERAQAEDPGAQVRAARMLARARTVHVAGFRACHAIAFAFHYLYRLFRDSVCLLAGEAGTLEMQLRSIGPKDATVIISFAPYSREARLVATAARRTGGRIVAITDSMVAPIALAADETILIPVASTSFFPSITPGIAVAETLIEILVSMGGEATVGRIENAERQLRESGAYEARLRKSRTPQ
ncbi:MAG: MurR/RpiR family transcriptional regulator [Rhodocyclaceae bacterium]